MYHYSKQAAYEKGRCRSTHHSAASRARICASKSSSSGSLSPPSSPPASCCDRDSWGEASCIRAFELSFMRFEMERSDARLGCNAAPRTRQAHLLHWQVQFFCMCWLHSGWRACCPARSVCLLRKRASRFGCPRHSRHCNSGARSTCRCIGHLSLGWRAGLQRRCCLHWGSRRGGGGPCRCALILFGLQQEAWEAHRQGVSAALMQARRWQGKAQASNTAVQSRTARSSARLFGAENLIGSGAATGAACLGRAGGCAVEGRFAGGNATASTAATCLDRAGGCAVDGRFAGGNLTTSSR